MLVNKLLFGLRLLWCRCLVYIGLRVSELYYVCGGDSLPSPLSREDEAEAISKLASGDPAVRSLLIEHNLRLVVYIARKFSNTKINIEDLISVGTIGLIKAINTFNVEKNIKLATYASRCIENEILMFLRRHQKIRTERSLEEPLSSDQEGNQILLSDILGTDPDIVSRGIEEQVNKELLGEILIDLSDRDQRIIELRFGLNGHKERTQKYVADLIGISQSYISRLEKKIITKIQHEFARKG